MHFEALWKTFGTFELQFSCWCEWATYTCFMEPWQIASTEHTFLSMLLVNHHNDIFYRWHFWDFCASMLSFSFLNVCDNFDIFMPRRKLEGSKVKSLKKFHIQKRLRHKDLWAIMVKKKHAWKNLKKSTLLLVILILLPET